MNSKYLLVPLRLISFLKGTFRSTDANKITDVYLAFREYTFLDRVIIPSTSYIFTRDTCVFLSS